MAAVPEMMTTPSPIAPAVMMPGMSREVFLKRSKQRLPSHLKLKFMEQQSQDQEATAVRKKLELFRKVDLKRNHVGREGLAEREEHSSTVLAPVLAPQTTRTGSNSSFSLASNSLSSPTMLSLARNRTRSCPKQHRPGGSGLFMHHTPDKDKEDSDLKRVLDSVQNIWIQRRAQQVEEDLEAMEMKDTLTMFTFQQARLEEERNRRQESSHAASQTGRTCHTILSDHRPLTAPSPDELLSAVTPRKGNFSPGKLPPPALSPKGGLTTDVRSRLGFLLPERMDGDTQAQSLSLSPYDNLPPRPPAHLSPKKRSPKIMETKIRVIPTTHPESMRSSSHTMDLDIVPTPETIVAPSQFQPNERPPESVRRVQKDATQESEEPPKLNHPRDPYLVERLFPILPVDQEVPSQLRAQQTHEVETIREAFARKGIGMPTSVIEKGIFTPEDRPFEECVCNLPDPEAGFVSDYTKLRDRASANKGAAQVGESPKRARRKGQKEA